MDDIDKALSLPTFGQQHEALHRLIRVDDRLIDDPRLLSWYRANAPAIMQMIQMKIEATLQTIWDKDQ